MRRAILLTVLALVATTPAAHADSWTIKGPKSKISLAAKALQGQGVITEKRPYGLIAHKAAPEQMRIRGVVSRKSVAARLAQDPVIPAQQWQAWNGVMGVETAWQQSQGQGAVVAIVDTGADLGHPDLKNQLWTNPREVAGNGLDDDQNGYVDDIHGVSVLDGGPPEDQNGHGTHVAGLIGAQLNDMGVNGIAPQARLMIVRALDKNGEGNSGDVDAGIRYALDNGAQIINLSVTTKGVTREDQEVIDQSEQSGVLVVGAAGNEGVDLDRRDHFPAGLDNDNVLTVGSVSQGGSKSDFSNYGRSSVDLGSFGEEIPSAWLDGTYKTISGTSMASPIVAGGAAILASLYPTRGALEWKTALTGSVISTGSLSRYFQHGGIINIPSALAWQAEQTGDPATSDRASFRNVAAATRKTGSKRTLRVSWSLAGGGAGKVAKVQVSIQGKKKSTGKSSITITKLRKGTATLRLKALSSSGETKGSASYRLRLR